MKLVLVAHRSGTAFQIRNIGVIVADNQCAFKLSCATGIDAEICTQFHGASYALGNIDKTSVAEHRGIQRGKVIVAIGNNRAQILAHQFGVVFHRFAYAAKDNAFFL